MDLRTTLPYLPAESIPTFLSDSLLHFYKTPTLIKKISKSLIWSIDSEDKEIYLTFDDGPIPSLTEYILKTLSLYNVKATFFCVGENISKYPELFQAIINEGHACGNHTYNHLKGWYTPREKYLRNIAQCQTLIETYSKTTNKNLFRPPHGQILPGQIKALKEKYKIIMWNVLAYDFDNAHSPQSSLARIIQKTTPGSITVFHDNYKAQSKMNYMLSRYIEHFASLGYQFKKIN